MDSEDEDVDDMRIVHRKALEMKETLAATDAIGKKLEKDRIKRAKEAGTLGSLAAAMGQGSAAAAAIVDPKVRVLVVDSCVWAARHTILCADPEAGCCQSRRSTKAKARQHAKQN